jgi:hypothetical protein
VYRATQRQRIANVQTDGNKLGIRDSAVFVFICGGKNDGDFILADAQITDQQQLEQNGRVNERSFKYMYKHKVNKPHTAHFCPGCLFDLDQRVETY